MLSLIQWSVRGRWPPRWSRVQAAFVVALILLAFTPVSPASNVTYTYNAQGQLVKATYDNGIVVTYSYDANGNRKLVATSAPSVLTPTNLSASPVSYTEIDLTWTGSSGATGYYIERCKGSGCGNFTQVGTASGASYTDTGLLPGTTYVYEVQAYDTSNNSTSAASAPASAQTPADTTPPTTPGNLTATASASSIALTWSASTDVLGVSGYDIQRCQGSGCTNFGKIATVRGTGYTDSGLTEDDTYRYRVRAYDEVSNYSGYSKVAGATIPDTTPPTVPSGLAASVVSWSTVKLTWHGSWDDISVAGYHVYRNGAQIGTTIGTAYTDGTTSPTKTYSYTVSAYDPAGNVSAQSKAVSVTTPAAPSPSAPNGLKAAPASDTSIALTWTAATDSGGPGIAGYKIYRNGAQIATTTGTSYTNTGISTFTWYTYSVAAYDKFGTTSSQVSTIGVAAYQVTSTAQAVAAGYSVSQGQMPYSPQIYFMDIYAPNGQEVAHIQTGTYGYEPACEDPESTTIASGYDLEGCNLWAEPSVYQH